MNGLLLIQAMEQLLVVRNPHHMATVRTALEPGYFLRGTGHLRDRRRPVIIGTGFPLADEGRRVIEQLRALTNFILH